jgi:Dolichyl-phosphate-mannose-protein mannosyltransferase
MALRAKLLLIAVFAVQVLLFAFIAHHRFIDQDEGAYLLASRMVLMHKAPYLDFFWNQAPLLPYVYAGWMSGAGVSWTAGRWLCVLLASILGLLVFSHVSEQTRNRVAGLVAVVMFVSTTLIFAWFPVVKTHCLAGLLLFAAYVMVCRVPDAASAWPAAWAGLLLGLSVETRSYLLLILPLFLWWVLRNVAREVRFRSSAWLLGGFVAGTLPSIVLFVSSPDVFLFDNLRYHGLRSSEGLIGWWQQKLVVLAQLFLGSREGNGLQWSILFLVSFALVLSVSARGYRPRFAFQIAVALMLIGLLPTPSYAQYFCLCVPFLIVSAVSGTSELLTHFESRRERMVAAVACSCVLLFYIGISAGDSRKYLVTGEGVPGVRSALDRSDWRIERVVEISNAVEGIAQPGESVASFWPGDIFQTTVAPLSGLENPFAMPVSDKLSAEQRTRYRIITPVDVESDFAAQRPRVVVLRNQILSGLTPQELLRMEDLRQTFITSLRTHGYTVVRSIGGISVYICCSNARSSGMSFSSGD